MREAQQVAIAHTPEVFVRRDPRTNVALIGGGSAGGWRTALDDKQQRRFASMAAGIASMGYEPSPG